METVEIRTAFCSHPHWPYYGGSSTPSGSSSGSSGSSSSGSSSGGSTDTPTGISTYIDNIIDEDGNVFFPITVLQGVIDENGKTAKTYLSELDNRLVILENAVGSPVEPRFANNLETDAKTVGLTAAMGKKLNDIISAGDVTSDGTKMVIGTGKVLTDHLADGSVTTDKIADDAVTEDKIADDSVTSDKVADNAIVKSKLSSELKSAVDTMLEFATYKQNTESRLTALEQKMEQHEEADALLKEQNMYLLAMHHKFKEIEIMALAYNPSTDGYDTNVSLDDVRMSGMKTRFNWHFVDTKEMDDATPDTINVIAEILYEDGTEESRLLSTDCGLNNIDKEYIIKNISNPCTITFKVQIHFCWLDWEKTAAVFVTE